MNTLFKYILKIWADFLFSIIKETNWKLRKYSDV